MISRFLISSLLFSFHINAQILWQFDKDSLITWNYQEGDEFNGNSVNQTYWKDWYGWGRSISGNKEQQYYSKYENHFVSNGILTLTAHKEDVLERYVDWMADTDSIFENNAFQGLNKRKFTYKAGLLQSNTDFLYGYFEIKFKIPKQKGFWPAFWLYGGSPNEEIDWMELKTEKQNQIHVGRHCQYRKDNYIKTLFGKKVWGDWVKFNGSLNDGYHIVSGIWTANYLKYFLNGECIAIAFTEMKIPKKLVVNIAVSSNKGSFPPAPDETFKDTVSFEVDYIRVWHRSAANTRTLEKEVVCSEPVTGAVELSKTKLISKSKLHYGNSSLHINEGFFVSLMPQTGGKYQLTVTGKNIPEDAIAVLTDHAGKIISKQKLKYGITTYDLFMYQSSELNFKIQAYNKISNYDFTVR